MFNLIILLIIWLIDLPLLENNPLSISGIKRKFFKLYGTLDTSTKILIESEQLIDEFNYQHEVGLYEYYLVLSLYDKLKSDDKSFFYLLKLKFSIICLLLYGRRLNIFFLVGSILLPIVFFYFFVLVDYYESFEEFFSYIWENYNYRPLTIFDLIWEKWGLVAQLVA